MDSSLKHQVLRCLALAIFSVRFTNHFIFQKWMGMLLNGVGIFFCFRSYVSIWSLEMEQVQTGTRSKILLWKANKIYSSFSKPETNAKVLVISATSPMILFFFLCFLSKNVFSFSQKCNSYMLSYRTSEAIVIYKAAVLRTVTLLSHVLTCPFPQATAYLQQNWKTF